MTEATANEDKYDERKNYTCRNAKKGKFGDDQALFHTL